MKLTTTYLAEHHSSGEQDLLHGAAASGDMLAPGGSTTCWGTSCTTTCI
jgi:hypothetical protein